MTTWSMTSLDPEIVIETPGFAWRKPKTARPRYSKKLQLKTTTRDVSDYAYRTTAETDASLSDSWRQSVTEQKQLVTPNTLRAQYLENSWRCYLATIAEVCCDAVRSSILATAWLLVMYFMAYSVFVETAFRINVVIQCIFGDRF